MRFDLRLGVLVARDCEHQVGAEPRQGHGDSTPASRDDGARVVYGQRRRKLEIASAMSAAVAHRARRPAASAHRSGRCARATSNKRIESVTLHNLGRFEPGVASIPRQVVEEVLAALPGDDVARLVGLAEQLASERWHALVDEVGSEARARAAVGRRRDCSVLGTPSAAALARGDERGDRRYGARAGERARNSSLAGKRVVGR